jgi:hypothetical protein
MKGLKALCLVRGTYCGYVDFDDERYWDYKFMTPFRVTLYLIIKSFKWIIIL